LRKSMENKKVLIFLLCCVFLTSSCVQQLQPNTESEPILIDGTPYENPMDAIEKFALQTKAAQTPDRSLIVTSTELPSTAYTNKEILYIIFSNGNKVAYSSLDLRSFLQTTVLVNDLEVTGVSLPTILEQAGWGEYDVAAVSLKGMGSLTILKDGIAEDQILVFNGSVLNFVSPTVYVGGWIQAVTVIEVY
jgi:hypothetical protein